MIIGFNHLGLSVANLERSVEFYRRGFGMQLASQDTFESARYDGKYGAILGLRHAAGRMAVLKRAGFELEVFEFAAPAARPGDPNRQVCDHGITHFCVEVIDIEREYQRLLAAGASFHCPPQRVAGLAAATYGRDPDGNVFELLEMDPEAVPP